MCHRRFSCITLWLSITFVSWHWLHLKCQSLVFKWWFKKKKTNTRCDGWWLDHLHGVHNYVYSRHDVFFFLKDSKEVELISTWSTRISSFFHKFISKNFHLVCFSKVRVHQMVSSYIEKKKVCLTINSRPIKAGIQLTSAINNVTPLNSDCWVNICLSFKSRLSGWLAVRR